jgi:hypothetical protein
MPPARKCADQREGVACHGDPARCHDCRKHFCEEHRVACLDGEERCQKCTATYRLGDEYDREPTDTLEANP